MDVDDVNESAFARNIKAEEKRKAFDRLNTGCMWKVPLNYVNGK